jgi:diguanylate cyclase (GGDEF)-like protein
MQSCKNESVDAMGGKLSVVLVSGAAGDAAEINRILCSIGNRVHFRRFASVKDFQGAAPAAADLVLIQERQFGVGLAHLKDLISGAPSQTPIVALAETSTPALANRYEKLGIKAVVSLKEPRLAHATLRNILRARDSSRAGPAAIERRAPVVETLDDNNAATAVIQDGCIVEANDLWAKLFKHPDERELESMLLLDLLGENDRPAAKQTLAACLARDSAKPHAFTMRPAGANAPIEFSAGRVVVEGEPAVRITASLTSATAKIEKRQPKDRDEPRQVSPPIVLGSDRSRLLAQLRLAMAEPLQRGVRMVAYVRPDRFSAVERAVGVVESEQVLEDLAATVAQTTYANDVHGRLSGTTFALLLERGTSGEIEAWAQQLCSSIAAHEFGTDERKTRLTCSVGLCEMTDALNTVESTLNEANEACYHARVAGGNRVRLAESTGSAREARLKDSAFADRIRDALRSNRFKLVHAPIVSLHGDTPGIVDTWARMIDVDGSVVLPKDFLPVAEEFGLLRQIDRWVIAASLDHCVKHRTAIRFVKLCRESILDESLLDWVSRAAAASRVSPDRLCLQVAEDVAKNCRKQTVAFANLALKAGFRIAVEHLGQDGDALELVRGLPMTYAKIDGRLIQSLASQRATIESIIRAAKSRKVLTIGERVEDASTMATLFALGVDFAQGDYFRPEEVIVTETVTLEAVNS